MSILQATIRARTTPLTVSPDTAYGETNPFGAPGGPTYEVTTSLVTASGGTGSYTWTRISGEPSAIVNGGSSGAVKSFNAYLTPGTFTDATFRCTSGSETVDVVATFFVYAV